MLLLSLSYLSLLSLTKCAQDAKRVTKHRMNEARFSGFSQTLSHFGSWSFILHMLCLHTGRIIAWEQRSRVRKSDCLAIRRGTYWCWQMFRVKNVLLHLSGGWSLMDRRRQAFRETHRSRGMLVSLHQVELLCWKEWQTHTHTHTQRATFTPYLEVGVLPSIHCDRPVVAWSDRHLSLDSRGKTLKHKRTCASHRF